MRKIIILSLLMVGAIFILISTIPLLNIYPYNEGPNSGPSNIWELVRMIAYDLWALFLIIGLALSIASLLGLRRRFHI